MSLVLVEGEPRREGWMYVGVPSSEDDFLKDIEEKQNPNFVNSYGLSALCMAVKAFKSPSLVEKLLKMNADPNFESYIGRFIGTRKTKKPSGSPLHVAAWLRHPGITKILLDGGADPNTVASNSLTPLLLVLNNTGRMRQRNEPFSEQAALDVMKLLIDNGADVTAVDNTETDGTSLLHMAAKGGHLIIVNYLLSLRALDVNCRDVHGETSLMIAASSSDGHELLEELLLHGADPNFRDMAGCTALHIAVGCTCVKSVEILIQNGADVNIKDNFCQTALHVASRPNKSSSKSNVEVMKSLLSNNADANAADNQGRRPLHLTVIDNKDTLDTAALECLLEHDADPSLTDAIERMPLSYYTAFDGDDIPKQIGLLSRGCSNLNHKDIMGKPPLFGILWYFMERRNIMKEESDIVEFEKVISELVEAGVDINCQDIEGSTCLHLTVGRIGRASMHLKYSDFTRVLLDAGADRNVRDVDGNTPAHIAAEGENADQLRMLASETWQDCPNLNGETVKGILCRKVTLAKERRKIGVDFEFAAETLHFVDDMMRDCRFGEVTVDIIETLDRKVPQAIRASGLTDTMIYPVPALWSILEKNVELNFTEVLEDLKEARVHTNYCRLGSTGRERLRPDCAASKPKQVGLLPLLWKTGHPCVLATRIEQLTWEFVQFKPKHSSSPLNMPPAPEAVTHIIRDILRACRDNTVGEFHFGDEQCGHERCEIGRQVRELVSDLVDAVGQMDRRFQCKLILTGSVAEEAKLWKPDEFDFMMELTQLKGHSRLAYGGLSTSSNTTVILLDDELKEMWREFLRDNHLSPVKLRNYLVLLTWRAGFSLQRQKYKNLSFNLSQQTGRTGSSQPLVRMSSVGVILHVQWHGMELIGVCLSPWLS
ncbi:uncharacterized protein [Acropora muricata]|uniref:uncharacterized protein LOC114969408 isoform X3 n=1 Tax=Acropora millepora TaxID=45264 RepID=UPI001CF50A77|nr:uncharacterized protein LOC114969408 isoform X3 [Acropora millepora]